MRASVGIWRRAPGVPCNQKNARPCGSPNSAKPIWRSSPTAMLPSSLGRAMSKAMPRALHVTGLLQKAHGLGIDDFAQKRARDARIDFFHAIAKDLRLLQHRLRARVGIDSGPGRGLVPRSLAHLFVDRRRLADRMDLGDDRQVGLSAAKTQLLKHPLADDPLFAQAGHLFVGQAQTAQDLVVVLAERRCRRAMVTSRPRGDAKRPARVAVGSGDRTLELLVEAPPVELGYVIHLLAGDHPL